MEQKKDFTKPTYPNPVMDMWEFFNDNPQYTLIDYKHVKDGIRAIYTMVH